MASVKECWDFLFAKATNNAPFGGSHLPVGDDQCEGSDGKHGETSVRIGKSKEGDIIQLMLGRDIRMTA